jgi:hypothetical protein
LGHDVPFTGGFELGHGLYVPQATPPETRVGGAVQAGTSLHAGGLSLPQETVAASGRAQAAMHNVRIRTENPPWAAVSTTTRTPPRGAT